MYTFFHPVMSTDPDELKSVDSALDALLTPSATRGTAKPTSTLPFRKLLAICVALLVSGFALVYVVYWRAPKPFPIGTALSITKGMTIREASELAYKLHAIRSPFWLKSWSIIFGKKSGVHEGDYFLSEPTSVIMLAYRLTSGRQGLPSISVTIPEGLSNREVSVVLAKSLTLFNTARFLSLAQKDEGYLFPDTYMFLSNATEEQVITEMRQNFSKRTESLSDEMSTFGKPLQAILTMASLIEGEARTTETRKEIAGILWKRLEIGMPLQVDAVFPYILGKNTFEITTDDLKIDSPYNTYKYAGLPPGPINNPGLDAITAAITPAETKYLYYLSDKDGEMHYATTHEEHLVNRAKYLGK